MIEFLPWDSQFFGLKIGRIQSLRDVDSEWLLHAAQDEMYQLLYIFSEIPFSLQPLPAPTALVDVGGQVSFRKQLLEGQPRLANENQATIRLYRQKAIHNSLLSLAFLSGHLSRFRVDPRLPVGSFERLYERWLMNTIEDIQYGRIYIAGSADNPEGMLTATWKPGLGSIDLLAVRADVQGRGIGSQLLAFAEREAGELGVDSIVVKTQMVNDAAKRAYARAGYTQEEASYLYHLYP